MKIAIIGASGFVGLRLVERWHLAGQAEVVPVVQAYRSLAVLARFALPWRVADASDPAALAEALRGCDAVVHAALGDPNQIVTMAEALYPAAERAGIKRIVALSSAAIHSLTPAPGTDETSPVLTRQNSDYNTAKARAEEILTVARQRGKVELVQLRPSIIHGARSRLVTDIASQLMAGTAWFVDEGRGICNAVGVDNLIDAIWQALTCADADAQSFLLNDRETITWCDFYGEIAKNIGMDLSGVHLVQAPTFSQNASQKLARLAAQKSAMAVMPLIPARVKRIAKATAAVWNPSAPPASWCLPEDARPHITEEMCLLQSCRWRYPIAKAERVMNFAPALSFAEGMKRTGAWLRFTGLVRVAATSGISQS